MIYKIEITNKAREDLGEIWAYSAHNWSIKQADAYYKLLFGEIEKISRNPFLGKQYDYIKVNIKGRIIKSHLILYKIKEANTVLIIRILHQKMDIEINL